MTVKHKLKIPIYKDENGECRWCSLAPKRSDDFAICKNPAMIAEYSITGSFILKCEKDCPGKLLGTVAMNIDQTTHEQLLPQLRKVYDDEMWCNTVIESFFLDTQEEMGFGNQLVRKV